MVEQRVIGAKIGAPRPIAPSTAVPEHKPEGAPDGSDKPKRSRKLLLVVLVVLAVVLAAAAAWFFLIHGKSTGAPEPEPTKRSIRAGPRIAEPVSCATISRARCASPPAPSGMVASIQTGSP